MGKKPVSFKDLKILHLFVWDIFPLKAKTCASFLMCLIGIIEQGHFSKFHINMNCEK